METVAATTEGVALRLAQVRQRSDATGRLSPMSPVNVLRPSGLLCWNPAQTFRTQAAEAPERSRFAFGRPTASLGRPQSAIPRRGRSDVGRVQGTERNTLPLRCGCARAPRGTAC